MPETTLPKPDRLTQWMIWFALLGGGVAWLLHLLLAYAIAEFGCVGGLGHRTMLGITAVAWMLIIVSLLATLLGAGATYAGWRVWLRAQPVERAIEQDLSADVYLARTGLISSAIFVLVIVAQTVPILFYLSSC